MGVQPHCEGEIRDLTIVVDDVFITGFVITEVVILPPLIKGSSQIAAPTSTDSGKLDSSGSNSDDTTTSKGDKVTKSFHPDGGSSKANMRDVVNSTNHLGAKLINLDAAVNQIAENVKAQASVMTASITSLQGSYTKLHQRLDTLVATQTSLLEN